MGLSPLITTPRRYCLILLFLSISTVSLVLSQCGWKNSFIGTDSLVGIGQAREFLHSGHVPQKACLSSFGSYIPPGSAWLMIPGVATGVQEFYERPGACVLFLITLVGIFVLSRQSFGDYASLGATAFFAFSDFGMNWATNLWPRGHAAFYVWMAALTVMWVRQRRAWILDGIILTFALGMYVHMEMAFAILAVGVCWVVYRPPIRIAPLALGLILSFVIWIPYLTFEMSRDFTDLRSQLLRHEMTIYGDRLTTNAADRMEQYELATGKFGPILSSEARPLDTRGPIRVLAGHASLHVWNFALQICRNLIREYPFSYLELPLLVWVSLLMVGTQPFFLDWLARQRWMLSVGIILVVIGILLNPWTLMSIFHLSEANQNAAFRRLCLIEAAVLGGGLCFITHRTVSHMLKTLAYHAEAAVDELRGNISFHVTILFLAVPWFLLALLAPEPCRIWGLWPLQVVVISGGVVLLARILASYYPLAGYAVGTLAVILIAASPTPWVRVSDWFEKGYGGRKPDIAQALDYVAARLKSESEVTPRIGYHLFHMGFECDFNVIDPTYRIGTACDEYLASQHGIRNQTVCAEGFSFDDELKIVEIVPPTPERITRFRFTDSNQFWLAARFGSIEVWLRSDSNRPKNAFFSRLRPARWDRL